MNQLAFGDSGDGLQSSNKGKWYFYNSQSLSFGKTEFQKIWGSRKLEDDWRWSEKATIGGASEKDSTPVNKVNLKYDLDAYLSSIPVKKEKIDRRTPQKKSELV